MHDQAALKKLSYGEGAYLHVLAETFRGAHADRIRTLGDPDFVKMDVTSLVARDRMAARRKTIVLDRTHRPEAFSLSEGGTSNVIVVDAAGNVAIVTSSLNGLFGAQVHAEGGVVLNDHLASFAEERDWRRFGGNRTVNAARGGARPVTSMSPTLVLRDGKPVLALAASGGPQMATAVAQGVLGRLAFGLSPERIVGDVRIDAPPGGGLRIDPRAPEALVTDLRRRGEIVDASRPIYGGLEVVAWSADGSLEAAFDPRKGGGVALR
jgi:gamma-glutamyltranspeptidase/glutathione hydrolase